MNGPNLGWKIAQVISVVVVGRNDSHGYNLSKRVASSLNSIAHHLTEEDEIIFVDWNTPIGYPAMPISIQDDLLLKTKKIMRTIKVSPAIHREVQGQSTRGLIEPIARNVGIRRANKNSDWILSTNTDILFASPNNNEFRKTLPKLEKNLWLSTRFEIPEFVWETLDRRDPEATTAAIQRWYQSQRFVKRIRVDEPKLCKFLIPDAVGDFQLATREFWHAVKGFPEDMKKGWHVDTRLTVHMARTCGVQPRLISENDLLVFHQNHLRNSTAYHDSKEINAIEDAYKPYDNSERWGLVDEIFEELDFNRNNNLLSFLELAPQKSKEYSQFSSLEENERHLDYDLAHVINYLADEISLLHHGARVHCYTSNSILKESLTSLAEKMQFEVSYPDIFKLSAIDNVHAHKVNLLILDYGIATSIPFISPFFSKRKTSKSEHAGAIAVSTKHLAALYKNSQTRVCCIRAQNWAIRNLARSYFELPLFNNFTSILSGQIKVNSEITFVKYTVFIGGVIADYGLSKKTQKLADTEKLSAAPIIVGSLLKLYRKYCPTSAKKMIKRVLKI